MKSGWVLLDAGDQGQTLACEISKPGTADSPAHRTGLRPPASGCLVRTVTATSQALTFVPDVDLETLKAAFGK